MRGAHFCGSAEHENKVHFSMDFTLDSKPLDPNLFTDTIPLPRGRIRLCP